MARPWSGASARYGTIGDQGEWKTAIDHYYWDRLEQAHALAIGLGVGSLAGYEGLYRMIESELATREQAEIRPLSDWLDLEWISAETHGSVDLGEVILRSCNEVADRFGYRERAKTLVSILASEADAPWAVARFGYMVDKYPYDKVCIPNNRIYAEAALHEVVAHEFAHVIVLNMAQGRVPKWLNEGIAMLAERSSDLRIRRGFAEGHLPWLSLRELEIAHSAPRQGEPHPERTWFAYQQSAWLVRYLVSIGGEAKIGEMLRAFADHSAWIEIRMRLTGQSPADEALHEVYGFGEKELFERTIAWLRN